MSQRTQLIALHHKRDSHDTAEKRFASHGSGVRVDTVLSRLTGGKVFHRCQSSFTAVSMRKGISPADLLPSMRYAELYPALQLARRS
jgi:hypothetical protein